MLDFLYGHDYSIARLIIQRAMAAVYLIGFWVAIDQFPALLGENGLLPVPRLLKNLSFNQAPSIFQFYYSDKFLLVISWIGVLISFALVLGLTDKADWWVNAIAWFILWALYMSIVNIGQTFYNFGWEYLLLEIGFLMIFIGSSKTMVPIVMIFLLRWLLFRLEFGAGLIKMRGDECWRDLTCLNYHHETQPMPGPLSWYFHNMPAWFHKIEVLGNHFVQLVVPFFLFLPQPFAGIASLMIIATQSWLVISGNFAFLNWMTIILAFSGIPNSFYLKIFAFAMPVMSVSISHQYFAIALAALILFLSYWPVKNMLSSHQAMNASFSRYHFVNTYGAFGSVTKERYEIVIEGTMNEDIFVETDWKEYEFKGKPGDPTKTPAQFAPFHLRLDWLMWFAAFGKMRQQHWFIPFIEKLLLADSATLKLIKHDPFNGEKPKAIRARFYLYEFTSPEERKESSAIWKRSLKGDYLRPARLG